MSYPSMVRIRQHFDRPRVDNVPAAVHDALEKLNLARTIRPGQTVALTAGSRGIANIALVLQAVVRFLNGLGARPFLIPAMGSHGSGTADGQRRILESYGITEAGVQAPIRASMEVVSLGATSEGFPVVLDRQAAEADHIAIVARVKPHTDFEGPIESGLLKMLMIGLGKHEGARVYHRLLLEIPYDQLVRSVCRTIRARAPVAFGVALVDNAYEETALIEAVPPVAFEDREEQLLVQARRLLPQLPCRQADLLIVDEIGKDISGSGMDTNVIGRKPSRHEQRRAHQPRVRHIFVRGLTARTQGNAAGIGMADFTTTRLVRAMDYRATVINCLTSGHPRGARLPVHFDTDHEVLDAALTMAPHPPESARVLRIRNTLCLEEVDVSETCLDQARDADAWTVLGVARTFAFDAEGNLPPF